MRCSHHVLFDDLRLFLAVSLVAFRASILMRALSSMRAFFLVPLVVHVEFQVCMHVDFLVSFFHCVAGSQACNHSSSGLLVSVVVLFVTQLVIESVQVSWFHWLCTLRFRPILASIHTC